MLNPYHSMEEQRAGEALCQLLARIPIIQVLGIVHEAPHDRYMPDFVIRVLVNGREHRLICEYKSNGQPRYARSTLLQLHYCAQQYAPHVTPVFIAPYISPAVRQLCEQCNTGYLDLQGNARLTFSGVYIERTVANAPATERRELKSLFRPKSAQVLRTMLGDPGRTWRVAELAEAAEVSLGHVSNVRARLVDREWARVLDKGLFLSNPDALLDAWRDSYTVPAGERIWFYTPLDNFDLEYEARQLLGTDGREHAVFASFSAAQWLAPYARTGTYYFFADQRGMQMLQTALQLAPAAQGGNVLITLPKDTELLADTIEPAVGAVCTNPIQTYLDLSIAGERGAEAAEHLRKGGLTWFT